LGYRSGWLGKGLCCCFLDGFGILGVWIGRWVRCKVLGFECFGCGSWKCITGIGKKCETPLWRRNWWLCSGLHYGFQVLMGRFGGIRGVVDLLLFQDVVGEYRYGVRLVLRPWKDLFSFWVNGFVTTFGVPGKIAALGPGWEFS
jgi:hypothetical protein